MNIKTILANAINALKSDNSVELKKHIQDALLLKVRGAVKDKKKKMAKKVFRNI
jgi:hypothetical protein